MRRMFVTLALVGLACGGDKGGQSSETRPGAPGDAVSGGGAAPAAARPSSAPRLPANTFEVRMEMVKGKYYFNPASVTIKSGDAIRWINISGGPHNVQFKKDRIPPAAQVMLNAGMPDRTQDLTGPFLTDSLASYLVTFANAPAGSYAYSCQPHELLGMVGTVTVSP